MQQITIGTKEKWHTYLGDLSIIIWVDQIPHTHQHRTPTCACPFNTKTKKIKKARVSKLEKNKQTKSQKNYGVKILHNF